MARPRRDGTGPAAPRKHKLNDLFIRNLKPEARPYLVWDTAQKGLAVQVQPTGTKSWKCVYAFHGRPRWLHLGDVTAFGLADARLLASRAMFAVAEGKDPAAERRAERSKGTFEELATQYVEQFAKRRNKSWQQADALVRKHLLPRWGKLQAGSITRSDVKLLIARIEAPIVANQVLASASAIFSYAIREEFGGVTVNPCHGVERNKTTSRERVLSESELPLFWKAFDDAGLLRSTALKVLLLTGQRPGEVSSMRWEHIADGWWNMPGEPTQGWPGTKNGETHRVWLPAAVQALLAELNDGATTGPVFKRLGKLDEAMREICTKLKVERATPHDLRRTHGSTITALGFGRDAMNRVQNHREGGIASVYDRHQYADENKRVMEAVAAHIMKSTTGERDGGNVVTARFVK